MTFLQSFRRLTRFEWSLWLSSVAVIVLSALCFGSRDYLSIATSVVGVTALIFVAKGYVLGQALCMLFALGYGMISFSVAYYGEMITYIGMSLPAALVALIQWIRHPYRDSQQVAVARLTPLRVLALFSFTVVITVLFYFILGALGTASLFVSTLSVATSFLASALTILRSPYYALAYAANDIVLIVMWLIVCFTDVSAVPMVACFLMFLFNDIYGFVSWTRMRRQQSTLKAEV